MSDTAEVNEEGITFATETLIGDDKLQMKIERRYTAPLDGTKDEVAAFKAHCSERPSFTGGAQ